jgi:hypothetical protein
VVNSSGHAYLLTMAIGSEAIGQAWTHQTVGMGRGRHDAPGPVVCVMELATMLAGERFGDRPAAVCPVLGSLLRTYNDQLDDVRRQDLYRFAADSVGTRDGYGVQLQRAAIAITWARERYESRRSLRRRWLGPVREPQVDDGPDLIAHHVIGSIRRHTDLTHAAVLVLFDELIAYRRARVASSAHPPAVRRQGEDRSVLIV